MIIIIQKFIIITVCGSQIKKHLSINLLYLVTFYDRICALYQNLCFKKVADNECPQYLVGIIIIIIIIIIKLDSNGKIR